MKLSIYLKRLSSYAIILTILFGFSSCTFIGHIVSTPTYSIHKSTDIQIHGMGNKYKRRVFIKNNQCDMYGLYDKAIAEIKTKLQQAGFEIVDSVDWADYTLNLNIKTIATGTDANFALNQRNILTQKEIMPEYAFQPSGSNPYILLNNLEKSSGVYKPSIMNTTLFTGIGSGIGGIGGYLLAGALPPLAGCLIGVVAVGGAVLLTYTTFRSAGVIVIYDIELGEKLGKQVVHNRKMVKKIAENASEDYYFSYNSNWASYVSKYAIIGIGSKVLTKEMIDKMQPMIVSSVANVFEIGRGS